ncbi:MAG TPA: hypothetical protein VH855_08575 [Acetobacteraceae bacterium]|jgi:hypothetical protein
MTLEVRRIVTGHGPAGKAIVASDERMTGTTRPGRSGIARCEIWSTRQMPVDNSDTAAAEQRKGFVARHNFVGSGQGTVVRITEFAPGSPKFMHRTETLDYAILLSGECDLELDDGKTGAPCPRRRRCAARHHARLGQQRDAAMRVRLRAD